MNAGAMMSVEEARARILDTIPRLAAETRPLSEALGQVLAEDAVSPVTIPPLDNTSMDGYAVRSDDTDGATAEEPVDLRVIGEVAAGYLFDGEVEPGAAVRIMTGAPMPRGADAIVPFEETDEPQGRTFGSFAKGRANVGIFKAAGPGANVRRAGEDVQRGATVMQAGTELRAAQVGVLASLGNPNASVYRRPIVAIISTGDELLDLGQPHAEGRIYDSNSYSVAALVQEAGGIAKRIGIARDTVEDLTGLIHAALEDADLLITTAGVSRGDYDVVKDVLEREGEVNFWTVRMRPGKPLAFGSFTAPDGRKVPHIGLPGNPVSSMVTFELFGRPAIYKMMGRSGWERPKLRVVVEDRVENTDGRRFLARAIVREQEGGYVASLTGPQGSGILTSMALANALVVCPEDVPALEPGDEAEALMLGPLVRPGA
jgi:molybdopterin molybdotransferase